MTKRHRSILESREIAIDCVFWLIVFLLAALAMQLLSFPSSNGDRQAIVSDTFDTPISAGQVGGTYSTGGQLRTVTDAESKASVADGKLSLSGGKSVPAAGDPGLWWPAVTRASGLTVRGTLNQSATTTIGAFGFDAGTSGTVSAGFSTAASAVLSFTDSAARNVGAYAAATDYPMAVQAGVSKWFAYLSESGIWKLKYVSFLNVSDTTIYPAISGNTAALTLDNLDVRIRPLPVPLASDSFNRADGALGSTDGQGHAEMNGGAGVAWTSDLGTWAISGNTAVSSALGGTSAFATVSAQTGNVLAMANLTRSAGNVGIVLRYSSETNHIVCIHNGTNGKSYKVVDGVLTLVGNTAATYAAAARMLVIADGPEVRLYYNNAYLHAYSTTDAQINNKPKVGLCTNATGNVVDNFYVFARGNEGQYSYMGDRR